MRQLLIFLFAMTLFAACNNNKGWSIADNQKGMKRCMDEVEGKVDDKTGKKYCSCVLEKVMAKYPSFDVADDKMTDEEVTKLGQACAKQLKIGGGDMGNEDEDVMDGKKGKKKGGLFGGDDENGGGGGWSAKDKNAFISPCTDGLVQQGYTRAQARQLCNCAIEKIEKKYSSLQDADQRGGESAGSKAMQECLTAGGGDDNDDN